MIYDLYTYYEASQYGVDDHDHTDYIYIYIYVYRYCVLTMAHVLLP